MKDFYSLNRNTIIDFAKSKGYMTEDKLFELLDELKENKLVSSNLNRKAFYLKLLDDGLIANSITIRDITKTRYSFNKEFNFYDFAYSLEKDCFFPMFTSLNIQGLSSFRNNFIFISKERKTRVNFSFKNITQASIDKAFKNKPKRTKAHANIEGINIVMLESNNTEEIGIINYNGYRISSINRAFVEIISNIHYFKTPNDVISEFKKIKEKLDIKRIFNIIEKFDFVYPYYQLAGYYLEQIGFTRNELIDFCNKKSNLKFYTMKNKENYSFDSFWDVFY